MTARTLDYGLRPDFVTCGDCGGPLELVASGGTNSHQVGLVHCGACDCDWVVETTMAKYRPTGHGTEAGYQRHRRDGSVVCDKCRCAHNVRTEASKARKLVAV